MPEDDLLPPVIPRVQDGAVPTALIPVVTAGFPAWILAPRLLVPICPSAHGAGHGLDEEESQHL